MKAVVYEEYGPPEVLQIREVARPSPKDNEVLVRVSATTVTSGDWRMRKGDPFAARLFNGLTKPKRITVLGSELSGQVAEVGGAVTRFKPGDQVYALTGLSMGANADYRCLPESGVVSAKPANIGHKEAAAIPFGATTALFFLRRADVRSGQKVLIYGASGAVGTAAVQLAKTMGANVTGVCSSENLELVKSIGADDVIDYTKEDFTRRGEVYDVVFDTVGKTSLSGCRTCLRKKGFYLAASAGLVKGSVQQLLSSAIYGRRMVAGIAKVKAEDLAYISELIEGGRFRPVIDRSYPMERIAEAHGYVEKGHKKGNVVITLGDV